MTLGLSKILSELTSWWQRLDGGQFKPELKSQGKYQQLYLRRQAQLTQELTRVQSGSNSLGKNYIRQNSHWHQITCEKFGDSLSHCQCVVQVLRAGSIHLEFL